MTSVTVELTDYVLRQFGDKLPLYFLTTLHVSDMDSLSMRYYSYMQITGIDYLSDLIMSPTGINSTATNSEFSSAANIMSLIHCASSPATLKTSLMRVREPIIIWIPRTFLADCIRRGLFSPMFNAQYLLDERGDIRPQLEGGDMILSILLLASGRKIYLPRKEKLLKFISFLNNYDMISILTEVFACIGTHKPHLFCVICEYNHLVTYRHADKWENEILSALKSIGFFETVKEGDGVIQEEKQSDANPKNISFVPMLARDLEEHDRQIQLETYAHRRPNQGFMLLSKVEEVFSIMCDKYGLVDILESDMINFLDILKTKFLCREGIKSKYVIPHTHPDDEFYSVIPSSTIRDSFTGRESKIYRRISGTLKGLIIPRAGEEGKPTLCVNGTTGSENNCRENHYPSGFSNGFTNGFSDSASISEQYEDGMIGNPGHLLMTNKYIDTVACRNIEMNDSEVLLAFMKDIDNAGIRDVLRNYLLRNRELISESEDLNRFINVYHEMH